MRLIGVRDLCERAVELLRQVREEKMEYVITDHGRPIAVLSPVDASPVPVDETPSRLGEQDNGSPGASEFWESRTVDELAHAQCVNPVKEIEDLSVGFWPENESIDEFIITVRQWRHEDRS